MTTKQVVSLFKKNNPRDLEECEDLGLKLIRVDGGAYRETYKIGKLPLIVKIPSEFCGISEGIEHSATEINTIHRVGKLKKYKHLRRYMPEVFYTNKKTGVLLMKKYIVKYEKGSTKVANRLREVVEGVVDETSNGYTDIYPGNIGYEKLKNGRKAWKLIDLGLVES